MRYERFAPGTALKSCVDHFWLIEADLGDAWHEEILVPNGRPTVLVSLGDTGRRKHPETQAEMPNASGFTGIGTGPVILGQRGRACLIAAQLHPFGPASIGSPAHIDAHVPMADWAGQEPADALEAGLSGLPLDEKAVRILEDWLTRRLTPLPDSAVAQLTKAYAGLEGEPPADIEAWASTLGISYRQLHRLFRTQVGISPKTALMIARYQALVGGLLAETRGDGLAQLALLQGYYDQAHANRDFRRFTGVTPGQFTRTLNGIAKMMHPPMSDLSNSRGINDG